MDETLNFPPNPILAAVLATEDLDQLIQRAIHVAQWGGLVTHRISQDLPLAIKPKNIEEAVSAGKAITDTLESLSKIKAEAAALFLAETEPLFQRLLAWHRWNRFYKAPWEALFERHSGMNPDTTLSYSTEGFILTCAFESPEAAQPHLRGIHISRILKIREIPEEDASAMVFRAARGDQQVYNKLNHRRQKRNVLNLGNNSIEEYWFLRTIAAYLDRNDLETLLA
jgi:hypothetical protein